MEKQECVGAMIVQEEKILLGRRTDTRAFYPDVWDVFGGHVEAGESLETALIRELQEELGITPTAFTRHTTWHANEVQMMGVESYTIYVVTAWTGVPFNCQPAEHAEIAWFTLLQLQPLSLALADYLLLFSTILDPQMMP